MTQWDPQKRDEELHHIGNLTRGLAVVSVGATLILGYGIAWGDQQRVDQADNRDAQQSDDDEDDDIAPSPSPSSSKEKKHKSKSGGS